MEYMTGRRVRTRRRTLRSATLTENCMMDLSVSDRRHYARLCSWLMARCRALRRAMPGSLRKDCCGVPDDDDEA